MNSYKKFNWIKTKIFNSKTNGLNKNMKSYYTNVHLFKINIIFYNKIMINLTRKRNSKILNAQLINSL
jgi:hypothetical protein